MFGRFLKMVKFTTKQPNRINLFSQRQRNAVSSTLSNIHTFDVACDFSIQLDFVYFLLAVYRSISFKKFILNFNKQKRQHFIEKYLKRQWFQNLIHPTHRVYHNITHCDVDSQMSVHTAYTRHINYNKNQWVMGFGVPACIVKSTRQILKLVIIWFIIIK